jgi:hypothetical protein
MHHDQVWGGHKREEEIGPREGFFGERGKGPSREEGEFGEFGWEGGGDW